MGYLNYNGKRVMYNGSSIIKSMPIPIILSSIFYTSYNRDIERSPLDMSIFTGLNTATIYDLTPLGNNVVMSTGGGFKHPMISYDNGTTFVSTGHSATYTKKPIRLSTGRILLYGRLGGITGCLKSDDNGSTWQYLTNFPVYAYSLNSMWVTKDDTIMVDTPTDVSSERELWKSTDGGDNWVQVVAKANIIGTANNKIYALSYSSKEFHTSTDYGSTWTTETGPVYDDYVALTIDTTGNIYFYPYDGNLMYKMQKSTDGGATFNELPNSPEIGADWEITFNEINGEMVSLENGSIALLTSSFGMGAATSYLSTDGGTTWTQKNIWDEGGDPEIEYIWAKQTV